MTVRLPSVTERPWRLFIALPIPIDAARHLEAALAPYRAAFPAARWQRPTAFHVTLRFLGATSPEDVTALVVRMARCGSAASSVRLATDGADGVVRRSGGVAWLRIGPGGAQVASMARCLLDDADVEVPPPGRQGGAPAPHVTVARRVDRALIDALGSRSLGDVAAEWLADRVVLYRSHTGTLAGSSYEPLAEVRL